MVTERTAHFSVEQERLCVYRQSVRLSADFPKYGIFFKFYSFVMCAIAGGMHMPRPTGRSEDSSMESVLSSFHVGSGDRSESLGFCGKCHSSLSKLTGLQNSGSYLESLHHSGKC